ncbi:MAG: hypothetical protein Q8K60_07800 [Parachlamydiaceae bacterium]|nr:hypothetical protein [Parachlamydiaceae bacterium]
MEGKCKIAECAAPDVPCHDGCEDYKTCSNFIAEIIEKKAAKEKTSSEIKQSNLNWTGQAFSIQELPLVSSRTSPVLIGIVGKAAAGKTSYLAMLYTLLLRGKSLKEFNFAGTKTILGWDELHHRLKLKQGSVPFPTPTPASSNRLYHFALRNRGEQLKDVLFSDASGEVFSLWSIHREDEQAQNARWIYANSNGFMLFIDCQALVEGQSLAKREIMRIAKQLSHDLKDRPVIAVWSKSDKKNEILPTIIDSLKAELSALFTNYNEIDISNFLEPGPDELVHENNLSAVNWLLERIIIPSNADLTLDAITSDDLLINYRSK